jgi:TP901 family phage tail tape measure protein
MIDEIVIKARLDTKQAEQEFDELKKKGNSTISDIEKNEVKLKVDLDTKQAEAKVNNLNKSSGLLGNITQKAKEGFSGLGSSLAGVLNPMTAIAGAGVAIVGTFFKMIDVNKKFQQSLAELQSITGVTTQDLQFYRNQAQEIARDKTLSSSLEETVNAFKLVGSAKPDLLQNKEALAEVTKQAILLSKASGDTLESSVNSLTGTLNQFNFGAEEAGRVIDVLAAGSKAGAVAIPDLSAGLEKFGAVAKANNVTVEQAVALQETLGDKQIQGAEAGTQLRNIILKLANAGKGYVDGQFDITAALEQTKKEFQNIQDPVKRSQELTKLFGLESVTAGQILLDSTDKFKQYTAAVGEQGVALSQAQTNTNTFDGALTRLSNSFEALLSGGGNLLNIFTPLVDVIAEALPSIGNFFTALGNGISTFFSESQYVAQIGDLFMALWDTIKEVGGAIIDVFAEILGSFGVTSNGASVFAKVFDTVMSSLRASLEVILLGIRNFKDIIVGTLQIIKLQVQTFVKFWSAIFSGDFKGAVSVVGDYIKGLSFIFENTFGKIKNNLIDFVKGILKIAEPFASMFNIDINKLNKQLDSAKSLIAKKAKGNEQIDAVNVTNKKDLKTPSGTPPPTLPADPTAPTEGEEKKANDAAKKRYAEAVKNEKEANDKIIKERNRLIDALNKPQEAKKAEIDTLTARGASKEEIAKANEELLQLEIDYANKVNIIRSDSNQKLTAKFKENIDARDKEIVASFEENKKISENELKLQNEKIKNAIAASQIVDDSTLKELQAKKQLLSETETLNDKEKEDKEKQLLEIEALILQSQNRILQSKIDAAIKAGAAENGELVKGLQEQLKANEELIDKNQRDINKNTKKNQDKALQEQKDKTKQALLEIYDLAKNGILLQIGLNPQDVDRVKASVEKFMAVLNKKEDERKPGEEAAAAAEAAGAAYFAVSGAIFASDTKRREEELAALQVQQEEELRLAGDNEQKKDLIKQKYALKEKEIKRKQAEADKKKAILDAVVNTAVGVIKAVALSPLTLGMPFAAIVAALGAAQIALIAAQPIPKFAKGGAVPSSDIQGMISGKPHAAGGVLIEAEGNEFITRRSQAMKGDNLGLLQAINMSDSERDAYINRHYVMPALQAKESEAAKSYRSSIIEAENNLIARVSSSTLKSIDRRLVETNQSIKGLAKKDYTW